LGGIVAEKRKHEQQFLLALRAKFSGRLSQQYRSLKPFVVSLSNHERLRHKAKTATHRPFYKLRASGDFSLSSAALPA